jgi:sensor c-di-GMP phosphodiesterase-like protein
MMRTLRQRVLITLAATLVAAACGVAGGFVLGRAITLRLTGARLRQSAERTIAEADTSSRESRALLNTMNASPYPYCSDAEIAYFRNLIFASEFLKEAGRMRDGKIDCSVTLGRLDRPIAQLKPDFSQADGTKVYKNFAPFKVGNLTVVSLQLGDSYVIFSPYIETHRASAPVRYISVASDDPSALSSVSIDGLPGATGAILTRNGQGRLGDSLYATRCSEHYFNCVTDYVSIADALRTDRTHFMAYLIMGGISGACFGFLLGLVFQRNRSLERQLRRAVAKDQLCMVYQPIVNLVSRQIVGAEALARWTDEDDFPVPPDVFIKIAEDWGFVGEITKLVVRQTLRDFGAILLDHPGFQLSINVAAADLGDSGFLPMLDRSLQRAGLPAQSLAIEITESSTAAHEVAKQTILNLRKRGHAVHIDDFGTGYSSLSYLHSLSIDAIKIDRSFTHSIGTEAVTVSILPQILAMAETLKLQVIVEGIETELQADFFAGSNRPILAQGWLFGRPVPVVEFERLLAEDEQRALVPSSLSGEPKSAPGQRHTLP